ncbi:MAG: AAA family ATPase [Chloroflexota bacterium]
MARRATLTEIQIRNYKNIKAAAVGLQALTVLVGPNGAGKSNFVDALSFVADCLNHSVQLAFANRGGIAAVRRKSRGRPPTHIGLSFRIDLGDDVLADYAFEIAARPGEAFSVARERCVVQTITGPRHEFEVKSGHFVREVPGIRPVIKPDRLALTMVSGVEEFRPVYDFLTGIRRYSLHPHRMAELQNPDPGEGQELLPDGSNAAAVLRRIKDLSPSNGQVYERICRLLSRIVPGTTRVEAKSQGRKETLVFRQEVGSERPWRFDARHMSEGTLHALGVLLAVYQPRPASLLAIEEPVSTLYPAATEILMDVLLDGTSRSQVVITTHSPDVLDNKKISADQIIAIESRDGVAQLTPLREGTRDVIRDGFYTVGELLRRDELQIDEEYARTPSSQPDFFGDSGGR